MAKDSVNKVILVGRLGTDPEVRHTSSGATVANFNLATNRSFKGKDGEWQDETDWHRIVVWNKSAEFCSEYVKKGNRIYVEGRLQTRNYEDNDGQKQYVTEVVAYDVQLLESKTDAPQQNRQEEPTTTDMSQGDVPF